MDYINGIAFGILIEKIRSSSKEELRKWTSVDDDNMGSFSWCCNELGLQKKATKETLLKMDYKVASNLIGEYMKGNYAD